MKTIEERIKDVEDIINSTTNDTAKRIAQEKLQVLEATKNAGTEGVIYDTLKQLETLLNQGIGTGSVDEAEVTKIVDDELKNIKIGVGNLDPSVLAMLGGSTKVSLNLSLPGGIVNGCKSIRWII